MNSPHNHAYGHTYPFLLSFPSLSTPALLLSLSLFFLSFSRSLGVPPDRATFPGCHLSIPIPIPIQEPKKKSPRDLSVAPVNPLLFLSTCSSLFTPVAYFISTSVVVLFLLSYASPRILFFFSFCLLLLLLILVVCVIVVFFCPSCHGSRFELAPFFTPPLSLFA